MSLRVFSGTVRPHKRPRAGGAQPSHFSRASSGLANLRVSGRRRVALALAAFAAWAIGAALLIGPRSSTVGAAFVAPLRVPVGRGLVACDTAVASQACAEGLRRGGN